MSDYRGVSHQRISVTAMLLMLSGKWSMPPHGAQEEAAFQERRFFAY
jgi:hypothetical protein